MGECTRQDLGRQGEDAALAFFLARGFSYVDRNWRCRFGEIDLAVERARVLHFVEVKLRTNAFQHPLAAISPAKRERFGRAVGAWLGAHPEYAERPYQIDAACLAHAPGRETRIDWIEGM